MSTFLQMMHEEPNVPVEITRGRFNPLSKVDAILWDSHIASITRSIVLPTTVTILEKLPEDASAQALRECAPQVERLLSPTLRQLPALLKRDAALRAVAVGNLMRLATPQRVRALMANAVLGKVWRAVAAFRRHDERVARLCDAFSAAVQHSEEMRAWVESTYNMQVRCSSPEPHRCAHVFDHHYSIPAFV
jgi:hypothetical protein